MKERQLTFAEDARTIGVIGAAHGTSHFFHLLLPPLFPLLIRDLGLSYAELGLLVSVFFVVSGVGQTLSGFLVDRLGALPVLLAALSCFAMAALVTALSTHYTHLVAASLLLGLGNASFHPADFSVLNKRVSPARLGHAFAVHGISGNLGGAIAPLFMAGISAASGSFRVAAGLAAPVALCTLLLVYSQRALLDHREEQVANGPSAPPAPAQEPAFAFLRLPAVWLCFSFFFWTTCAMGAIQSFASPALQRIYDTPLSLTAPVVTGYMLCSAVGMLGGGFMAARAERLERIIALCLSTSALLLCSVGLAIWSGPLASVVAAAAGFGVGLAGPSRDMLIKRATPAGAAGRVYGTVYAGLDLGFALSAPIFGAMLDRDAPHAVFLGAALALLLAVGSALTVSLSTRALSGRMAPA